LDLRALGQLSLHRLEARFTGRIPVTPPLIAAILAAQVFEMVRSVAVLRVEGKMDGAVQAAVWDRVLALPVPFFRGFTAGDLANRINGINVIRHALSGTMVATLLSSLFTLLNVILLFLRTALAVVAALSHYRDGCRVDHRAAGTPTSGSSPNSRAICRERCSVHLGA
jgi:hypothetical protein